MPTSELLTLPGFREPKSVDVDLANQLFAQAGVRPRDVVVSVIIASFFADFGEALQAVLAKTGVSANLRILAGAEHSSATSTGDFDIALKNGGQSWDDPADIYIENFTTGGVTNYGRWSDPEVDRLAEAQDKELDPAKRQKLTQELSRRLIDEALYVPIANSPNATGTQPHISGFVVGPFTVGSHLRHELLWFNNR